MPTRRKDETEEDFRVRNRDYQRGWQKARVTKQYDANGSVTGKSVVRVPKRKPYERLSSTTLARRSALVDAEGNILQQWLIEKPEERAKLAAWEEMAAALSRDLPRVEVIPAPTCELNSDLLACYPIGDHHLGMLSWWRETGASYDLDIGESLLASATSHLVACAPPCDSALVVVLGDFMHYDSMEAVTPTHRNLLDADGRFPKLIDVATRSLRHMITTVAGRHGSVHVIIETGNHDKASMAWMRHWLLACFENNPRITVDRSPDAFHYYEFGKNMIATHHGDGRAAKSEQLGGIVSASQAKMWGRTEHRVCWTGHVHHQAVKDYPGMTTESFRVLPPGDAYAHSNGYRSRRDMKTILLHREHGEVARYTVNPAMLERKAA